MAESTTMSMPFPDDYFKMNIPIVTKLSCEQMLSKYKLLQLQQQPNEIQLL